MSHAGCLMAGAVVLAWLVGLLGQRENTGHFPAIDGDCVEVLMSTLLVYSNH